MTLSVGLTNGTDTGDDDHTTNYGSGTAFVIVLLGLLLIGMVISAPWFLGDEYYTPLSMYPRKQQVILVRADTPIVQSGKAAPAAATPVATSGGTLVGVVEVQTTPDLSCLKNVYP